MDLQSAKTKPIKIKSLKKQTTVMGFRMNSDLVERLDKLGKRGIICCDIVSKFISVRELADKLPPVSNIITGKNGAFIYSTDIGDDLHHITMRKDSEIIVVELTTTDLAKHITNMVEVLNKITKPKS